MADSGDGGEIVQCGCHWLGGFHSLLNVNLIGSGEGEGEEGGDEEKVGLD